MTPATVSPGHIHKLDPRLINQIAAGEVIVRPASAIKELVENSFDAAATRIEIAVEEDTRSFSVRDDGCGMGREDAVLSIERYATSKITEFDDLARLTTRGFRGEALAAISAVSRFELMTRRAEDAAGTHLRCEGGKSARIQEAGLPEGTTILVRDLFFNTPARMKFMRNGMVEWGHILKEVLRQALTRPDVAFSIKWRGKPYLNLSAGQSLRERLGAILPAGAGVDLLDVDHTLHGVRAHGCISSPKTTRRDRRHQYFFANGRPIFARPLTFALQEAYKGLIMTQQFPLAALFLDVPGGEIDVNVHPTKEEVRFRNEALITGAIHRGALEALRKADLVPKFAIPATPGAKFARTEIPPARRAETVAGGKNEAPTGFFSGSAPGAIEGVSPAYGARPTVRQTTFPLPKRDDANEGGRSEDSLRRGDAGVGNGPALESDGREAYPDETAQSEATLIARLLSEGVRPQVFGQIALTYILADAGGLGILMLDQHAAHEKILYLDYQQRRNARAAQELLVPYTYEAAPAERAALDALLPALQSDGFGVEHFGGGTFVIQSVPVMFDKLDVPAFLRDLTDDLGRGNIKGEIGRMRHKIGAMAACRAAVKSGDPLSMDQMRGLLDQVLQTSGALRCPHGRPTMLLLTREQLDRQFGRI
ncbi:DNA mismatch repair endonuclease MutL [Candidatus Sumerlaeota bacterium]|nr:DNA mismatch repair endonuclease MutL [Candidatus Sumerlaeota bacterium]